MNFIFFLETQSDFLYFYKDKNLATNRVKSKNSGVMHFICYAWYRVWVMKILTETGKNKVDQCRKNGNSTLPGRVRSFEVKWPKTPISWKSSKNIWKRSLWVQLFQKIFLSRSFEVHWSQKSWSILIKTKWSKKFYFQPFIVIV